MNRRSLLYDDHKGVGEPLNETGLDGHGLVVRGIHRLSIDPAAIAGQARRSGVADLLYRPVANVATLPQGVTPSSWVGKHASNVTGLRAPLPPQLHLLTVHAWGPSTLLLRLSHSYETGEDATLSQPASANLATLFSGLTITACDEMTLTANQRLAEAPKVSYRLDNGTVLKLPIVSPPPSGADLSVTLGPMEIRTFMCTFAPAATA